MSPSSLTIRVARASDVAGILATHRAAFGRSAEAELVQSLIAHAKHRVSLVAVADDVIVGHILFSPVSHDGLGLAPLAVLPTHQRRGIGRELVERGLAACRSAGYPFVVVLGDPTYYGSFGFRAAIESGIGNEYGAGEEFMVLVLRASEAPPAGSVIRYGQEFTDIG